MSPEKKDWKPNDSVIEGPPGKARIAEALAKRGVQVANDRVTTSRDPGIDDVRFDLGRPEMPPGFHSWQLPFIMEGPLFFFITVAEPGAVVPTHEHKRDLFRMVVSGSLTTNGIELKPGDWMYVPKGVPYSYSAALNPGVITCHCYG